MLYCHDTYGLGHLRRTLALATHLLEHAPSMSQLIVTGSPVAEGFPYPTGADYIKLPCVVKTSSGQYAPRSLLRPLREVRDLRSEIVLSAARHFEPDVLVVDHAPLGFDGEVLATLCHLKDVAPHTQVVLGLRDVLDEPRRVRATWEREAVYEALEDLYDRILIYGQPDVFDVVREYELAAPVAAKTRYVGYLRRGPGARSAEEIRAELRLRPGLPFVLVMAGGGGDGYDLFRTVLDAVRLHPREVGFDCLVVGGPLMAPEERQDLEQLVGAGTRVHFLDFTSDLTSYIGAADAVISMGGYNSVCEILSLGKRALIVPRVRPRQEQLLRAEALRRLGIVRMIHPDDLTPRLLLDEVHALLASPAPTLAPLDLEGLPTVATEITTLLGCAAASRSANGRHDVRDATRQQLREPIRTGRW